MQDFLDWLTNNWSFVASNINILLPMIVFYTIALAAFIMWLVKQQVASKTSQIDLYKDQISDLEKRIEVSSALEEVLRLKTDIISEIEEEYELKPKILLSEETQDTIVSFLNLKQSGAVRFLVDLKMRAENRVPFQLVELFEKCDWKCEKFFFETSEWIAGESGIKVLSFSGSLISDQTMTIVEALQKVGVPHEVRKFNAQEKPYGIETGAGGADCILLFYALDAPSRSFDFPDWSELRSSEDPQ